MKRLVFASALGLAAIATVSANAADMRRPAPMAAPAPMAVQRVFSWTGFYIGGNVGGGWSDTSGTISIGGPGGGTGPINGSGSGVLGGAQIGYNWQVNALVVGVEADIQASSGRGNLRSTPGAIVLNANTSAPWFGTVRGRIGYAAGTWMPYVTAGAVFGDARMNGTQTGVGPFNRSSDYVSWTVGGGIEAALWDRWSVKGEYLFVATPNRVPIPPRTTALTGSVNSHILRVGLNYHF